MVAPLAPADEMPRQLEEVGTILAGSGPAENTELPWGVEGRISAATGTRGQRFRSRTHQSRIHQAHVANDSYHLRCCQSFDPALSDGDLLTAARHWNRTICGESDPGTGKWTGPVFWFARYGLELALDVAYGCSP